MKTVETVETTVEGSGGALLKCVHTAPGAGKRTILLALPFGVPAVVAEAAFEKFSSAFDVVTWETRYLLNSPPQPLSGDECFDPEAHAEDMLCIAGALGFSECVLVGYCSGAGLALVAATRYPRLVTELVLVNGEYQLFRRGHASTDYQRSIDSFLPLAATSRRQASFLFSKMADISRAGGGEASELEKQIQRPFSQEESLYRYALNYQAYRDFDALALAREIRQETFVLTGRRDVHVDMENSEAIAGRIADSRWFLDDEGDHYELCRAGSRILDEIDGYLRERASRTARVNQVEATT